MKPTFLFIVALLVLASEPAPASAQIFKVPRFELGGEGGLLMAVAEGLYIQPIVGPRVTFNISQRDAIELAADTLFPKDFNGTYGVYFLQYKHAAKLRWKGTRPFFAVGTGGYYTYRKVPEHRTERPDRSVIVYPARSEGELSGLNVVTIGGGLEQHLNRHASIRIEGSGFLALEQDGYLAFRILAGVSVPIGSYRENTKR